MKKRETITERGQDTHCGSITDLGKGTQCASPWGSVRTRSHERPLNDIISGSVKSEVGLSHRAWALRSEGEGGQTPQEHLQGDAQTPNPNQTLSVYISRGI